VSIPLIRSLPRESAARVHSTGTVAADTSANGYVSNRGLISALWQQKAMVRSRNAGSPCRAAKRPSECPSIPARSDARVISRKGLFGLTSLAGEIGRAPWLSRVALGHPGVGEVSQPIAGPTGPPPAF
jgi:hypothetical protein